MIDHGPAAAYASKFPPVYVTVDVVLLTIRDERLQVLMIWRGSKPWRGSLALPGGFLRQSEDLADGARRELRERPASTSNPPTSNNSAPSARPTATHALVRSRSPTLPCSPGSPPPSPEPTPPTQAGSP